MSILAKTDKQHWDNEWVQQPRMRLPSGLFIGTRILQRLLKRYVTPGTLFLEIGCAPGKMFAWVAKVQKAEIAGIDYSVRGIEHTRQLFDKLDILGNLRCEDIFETSLQEGSFDCVFSCGVIEHFDTALF
jgi:2-polyprenyl-3-methyl-5-hydroxy-6-metoxy-1,4-benzoquinol methylase